MEKKYYASIQFKKHSAAMRFLLVKLVFSARSPPFQKTFGRDAFYYCKTAFFCKIAPHFKKHSAAMHFTIVKLPFSARSPPNILCVDKIGSRPRGNLCVDKIGSVPQDRVSRPAIPFSPGRFWRAGRLSHYAPTTAHSHG